MNYKIFFFHPPGLFFIGTILAFNFLIRHLSDKQRFSVKIGAIKIIINVDIFSQNFILSVATKNLGSIGSAVFTSIGLNYQQTDRQTNNMYIFIYKFILFLNKEKHGLVK